MRFSAHAVQRFVERLRPDMSTPAALATLRSAAHVRLRKKSPRGDLLFRAETEPPCILIVRMDHGPVCVTILAEDEDVRHALRQPEEAVAQPIPRRSDVVCRLRHYLEKRAEAGDQEAAALLNLSQRISLLEF